MDEKVLIPIIVSVITTLLTLFFKSIFDKNIEQYRNRQNHSNESAKALRSAISSIQLIKDSLQIISDAYKDSISSIDVNEKFLEALNNITKTYQENGSFLSKEEAIPFHSAKNFCVNLQHNISDMLKKVEYPSELEQSEKLIITDAHAKLSEYQNRLRDFRDERIQ